MLFIMCFNAYNKEKFTKNKFGGFLWGTSIFCTLDSILIIRNFISSRTGKLAWRKIFPLSSDQFSPLVVFDSETPWTAACQASLSITNSQSLLKLMSTELVSGSFQ